ncbi:MAG: phosphoribosylglycinamide formyltransferase [Bacteroidota bacterium]|nr:phosphoribosylglycinamide formyltransferase [Bacteroidota bacterium]
MKKIAIFASGNGSNAQCIAEYFKNSPNIEVSLILSNKPDAYVLKRAVSLGIPYLYFNRDEFYQSSKILDELTNNNIDFIVLAGFLWLVPQNILQYFNQRIVNIHPALLPKYGGKGMYGDKVHEAVIENQEKETGISIHWVNEEYDEGRIIFQGKVPVEPSDTPESIAGKVHQLEYKHYPEVIEQVVLKL